MKDKNPHLVRRLEESSGYFGKSFSNRYMNWKIFYSIRHAFCREIERIQHKESIKVLDLGCGDGWLIYRLKAEFAKKYKLKFFGTDLSVLDVDFANKRKEYFNHKDCFFHVMDARDLSFRDKEFDIVISSELLEHILETYKVIHEVHRVLRKRGLFILTTPQKNGGLLARFLRLIKSGSKMNSKKNQQDIIDESEISKIRLSSNQGATGAGLGHVSVKSRKEWRGIFNKEGFELISMKGTGGLLFGAPQLDNYRTLFALTVILDVLLEKLPLSCLWSETLFFELRK